MSDLNDIKDLRATVRQIMVCHAWVENAVRRVENCYAGALDGGDPRGLAIIGESGTGKSRILKHTYNKYAPSRDSEGRNVPVLLASVPPKPTVKGLAEHLLEEIGDPQFGSGSEQVKTARLKKLMRAAGTRLLMLDEFQHFVDQGSRRVQHHVADWMKVIIDGTGVSPIVAGLPYCTDVFETNSQLKRRFQAPAWLPRFDWRNQDHRIEFRRILVTIQEQLRPLSMPDLSTDEMGFRMYCATGGLVGRLANLLTEVVTTAVDRNRRKITLADLDQAYRYASFDVPMDLATPFTRKFSVIPSDEVIARAMRLGEARAPSEGDIPRRGRKPNKASAVLSKAPRAQIF